MSNNTHEFRIYVASLSDYNNGTLHGTWIDFNDCPDVDYVWWKVRAMLAKSPFAASDFAKKHGLIAEEWAIHDYELPGSLKISEYEDFESLWMMFENMNELEDEEIEPFFVFLENRGGSRPMSSDIDDFREAYQGPYDSEADFAEDLMKSTGELDELPERFRYYFDFERYGRDLFIGGNYWMTDGYVFANY